MVEKSNVKYVFLPYLAFYIRYPKRTYAFKLA